MHASFAPPCPLRPCVEEAVGAFAASRPDTTTRIILDPRVPAAVFCHPPDLVALTVLLLQSAPPSARELTLFVFEADDPHARVLRFELLGGGGAELPEAAALLAEELGGEVHSSCGPHDSRTWFSISADQKNLSRAAGESAAGSGLSVLVVEDNHINQRAAEECLRGLGAFCRVAGNGAEGARLAAAEAFDLILMNIHMPVMDGITATRTIRAQPEGKRPFIAALTAFAQPGDRVRCLQAGMDDFLTKPCRVEILVGLLGKVCARKKTFPGRL